MNTEDQDIQWTTESILGLVLVNAEHDSNSIPIDVNRYYRVGKHLPTGMLIILLDEDRPSAIEEFWNEALKKKGRLN